MSGSISTFFQSPTQASDVFSQSGRFPKQRHNFIARFFRGASGQTTSLQGMTFALKSVSLPSVQPHAEELNQYGKKRFVYTNYKTSPIKVSLYDTADQSGLAMWNAYTQYYFGDFSQTGPTMFSSRDILGQLNDNVGNYGFTATNGGNTGIDSQYFFSTVEIIQFHNQTYDLYTLVNPRIVEFSQDELDYEQNAVSMITLSLVYEAYLMTPNAGASSQIAEFQYGQPFYGTPLNPDIQPLPVAPLPSYATAGAGGSAFGLGSLLQSTLAPILSGAAPNFRAASSALGSVLSSFGSFSFGVAASAGLNATGSLIGEAAATNPGLANALNLTYSASSLSSPYAMVPGSEVYGAGVGVSEAAYNSAAAGIGAALTGNPGALVSSLEQAALGGIVAGVTTPPLYQNNGVVMSPTTMSYLNAIQPGSAQYGYNANTTGAGLSYGQNGSTGYSGPYSNPAQPTQPYDMSVTTPVMPYAQAASATVSSTPLLTAADEPYLSASDIANTNALSQQLQTDTAEAQAANGNSDNNSFDAGSIDLSTGVDSSDDYSGGLY